MDGKDLPMMKYKHDSGDILIVTTTSTTCQERGMAGVKCEHCLTRRSDIHSSSPRYMADTQILEAQSTLLNDEPGIVRAHSVRGI